MKKILLCAAVFALFVFPQISPADDRDYDEPQTMGLARVTYLSGDTLFNSPDTDDWAALSPNFTLRDGDRLWAGEDSKLEVGFSGGHNAWLNYGSELDIARLVRDPRGDTIQLGLPAGEASFRVRRLERGDSVFQVDTPTASVRAYKGAEFRVTALSDGSTQVGVSKGSVELETEDGITKLKSGEMAEVDPDGYLDIAGLPPVDSWDRWVDSRASRYDRPARSARYLPSDLDDYAYEFDEGGRWTSYPEYGNVWVPRVAYGWSPYSNGRWVWIAGDYCWLPYDPWYAPFHYGRWSYTVSIGWFWVPPVARVSFWSPGYVGWVWGPDDVYWVPLAPREIYYGHGYYGPHSVNVHKTKIVNVTNVYVNSRVNNGVVVVKKNNFLKGQTRREKIRDRRDNPFIHRGAKNTKLVAAAPVKELRPVRETRLPKPDVKPREKALPPRVLDSPHKELKKRAVARTENESAIKPGTKPRKMQQAEPGERAKKREERRRERQAESVKTRGAARPAGEPKEVLPGEKERRKRFEQKEERREIREQKKPEPRTKRESVTPPPAKREVERPAPPSRVERQERRQQRDAERQQRLEEKRMKATPSPPPGPEPARPATIPRAGEVKRRVEPAPAAVAAPGKQAPEKAERKAERKARKQARKEGDEEKTEKEEKQEKQEQERDDSR